MKGMQHQGNANPQGGGPKVGAMMKSSKSFIITLLVALTSLVMTPLAAQPAEPSTPETPFEARVSAAKAAMMGDPEAALRHAQAATALSRNNPSMRARLIE